MPRRGRVLRGALGFAAAGLLLTLGLDVRAEDPDPSAPPPAPENAVSPWEDPSVLSKRMSEACDAVEKECGAKFERRPRAVAARPKDALRVLHAHAEDAGVAESVRAQLAGCLLMLDAAVYEASTREVHVVAGLRDPSARGEFSVAEDDLRLVLVREAVHALDAERFHTDEVRRRLSTNDGRTAFATVYEGHAFVVTQAVAQTWGLEDRFARIADLDRAFGQTARVATRLILAERVYALAHGADFVHAVLDARGREGLDAVLADPPADPWLVEHPDRFLAGATRGPDEADLDLIVDALAPLVADSVWSVQRSRIEEAGLESFFAAAPEARRPTLVAAFEAGRSTVATCAPERALVGATVMRFDTPEHAKETRDLIRATDTAKDETLRAEKRLRYISYRDKRGSDGGIVGYDIVRRVETSGDEMLVQAVCIVLGRYVVSVSAVGTPDINLDAIDAAIARADVAIRDPEAARKASRAPALVMRSFLRPVKVTVIGPDGSVPAACELRIKSEDKSAPWARHRWTSRKPTLRLPRAEQPLEASLAESSEGTLLPWSPVVVNVEAEATEFVIRMPAGRVITGTVVDPDGKPVPGITIKAYPSGTADTPLSAPPQRGPRMPVLWWHGKARSGPDGAFRLDSLGSTRYGLSAGDVDRGWAAMEDVDAGAPWSGVSLVVERVVGADVTVLGPDGNPVDGAFVYVRRAEKFGAMTVDVDAALEVTDANGKAHVRCLRPSDVHTLEVSGRLGVYASRVLRPWTVEPTTVRLAKGRALSGYVHDATGPVAATLRWTGGGLSGYGDARADGLFSLPSLPDEDVELVVTDRGFGRERKVTLRVAPGETQVDVVLAVGPLVRIAGLLKGRRVEFIPSDGITRAAGCEVDGAVYAPDSVKAAPCTVWVDARDGKALLAFGVPLDGTASLAMQPTQTISGRLTGSTAFRSPGIYAGIPGRPFLVKGKVATDGTFTIEVPPGHYPLRASASVDGAEWRGAAEADAGAKDVEVRLAPTPK